MESRHLDAIEGGCGHCGAAGSAPDVLVNLSAILYWAKIKVSNRPE